jgi:hypothetical protein
MEVVGKKRMNAEHRNVLVSVERGACKSTRELVTRGAGGDRTTMIAS